MRVLEVDAENMILTSHYDEIDVVGADVARNCVSYGGSTEIAYFDTADRQGDDPGTRNPYLFWIAGVDRTYGGNINVNVQFFQRYVRRYRNPEEIEDLFLRYVGIQNAITYGQQERLSNGFTIRVATDWLRARMRTEVLSVIDITRDGGYVQPSIAYAFNDRLKASVGTDIYWGPDESEFGRLKKNRDMFAEIRFDW